MIAINCQFGVDLSISRGRIKRLLVSVDLVESATASSSSSFSSNQKL